MITLRHDAYQPFAVCEDNRENQFARAGLPVIERLAEDLADLPISLVLIDSGAKVIGRVVGAPAFASALDRFDVTVAAPITDPRSNGPAGAVGITCAIPDAAVLLLPYAQLAARTIADRMVDIAAVADRALLEHFLRARRRARGPVIAVNGSELLTNAAASQLVEPDDHARLWHWAIDALEARVPSTRELHLGAGTVTARCEPVFIGSDAIGALIHVQQDAPAPTTVARKRARTLRPPTFGWDGLRSSELGIAKLVAEGLTNREVAARIFVSPHTVDFHLRQIYRKLSITSRIELARLVIEHDTTSVEHAA